MSSETCEVAIVGAGPHGLSAAAHLRSAHVETRIFGKSMGFWETSMPQGMILRSSRQVINIAHPSRGLTINHFEQENNYRISTPLPLNDFIRYGRWYQSRVVPDLDRRQVRLIESHPKGFKLLLEDGESQQARRVIVAAGIATFAQWPQVFADMPHDMVSHTSEHCDFSLFRGRRVLIVGGGHSAMESAALLHEAGSEVEVIVRAARVIWQDQHAPWLKSRFTFLQPLLYPSTGVGPPGFNLIIATPGLFRRLPASWQEWIANRSTGLGVAGWLVPRLKEVPITIGRSVRHVAREGDGIVVELNDGTKRRVDHVLLATGYKVDVARYDFLSGEVLQRVQRVNGYPTLGAGFESTVAGMHFIGAPATLSFGPICKFVLGTPYTGRTLLKCIRRGTSNNRAAG